MELHERFMRLPTVGINILETLADDGDNESQMIRKLVEAYNKKISNNGPNLKTLQTFRMILCYEYQSLINSRNSDEPLKCQEGLYSDLRTLFLKNNGYRETKEFSLLYDIVLLQLILSGKSLSFKDFWDSEKLLSSPENINLAMKVIECFVDSYNMHTYLYKSQAISVEPDEESTCILTIIQSWIEQKEGLDWKLLASLLPKLTITFGRQKIISPLWQHIAGSLNIPSPFTGNEFSEISDLEEKLAMLCVMIDLCFPLELEQVEEFHYEQCLQHEFWYIVNRGLISKNFQQRKHALYLMKRAFEFVDIHESEIKKRLKPMQKSAMPFVCPKSDNQASSLQEIKKNFFLILEVLEEKQKHLVLPALAHLPSFSKVQEDHLSCCDCFNSIWMRCVHRRIVQHENENIKSFGLHEILKLEPNIFFDNEFLLFFVDALNNTLFYDYSYDEDKPKIADELAESFLLWEDKKITLINSFVRALPSVSWGGVAIYWIVQALLAVTDDFKINANIWGDVEMQCVEKLIQKSMMRSQDLGIYTQVLIIRTFIEYTTLMRAKPSNLQCIFSILCSFPDHKNLKPDCSEWTNMVKHLKKIVQTWDAVEYVSQRCENMFTTTQNLKTLASTIYLLLDAELIFVTEFCPAEKALRKLLDNLIGVDSSTDENVILKVLEFSGHLLCPHLRCVGTLSEAKVVHLMDSYIDPILKIVYKSLDNKSIGKYDDYLLVLTALLEKPMSTSWDNVLQSAFRMEVKCTIVISKPHDYGRQLWSYAVKMLYICCQRTAMWSQWKFGTTFIVPLLEFFRSQMIANKQKENTVEQNGDPRDEFAKNCAQSVAQILFHFFFMSSAQLWPLKMDWINYLQALIATENERVIGPVSGVLRIVLDESDAADHALDAINSIVRMCWRIVFHLKKTPIVYNDVDEFTRLITSEGFQKLQGSKEYVKEFIAQMMLMGEKVPILRLVLIDSTSNLEMICTHKAFMSYLLHVPIPSRYKRTERIAIAHGLELTNYIPDTFSDIEMDNAVKAIECVSCLFDRTEVQDIILKNILEILVENKNKPYSDNSHLHRVKQRVMQTLLIQDCFLNPRQTLRLHKVLCDLFTAETNSRSVRLMQEWLLIKIHASNPGMRDTIWKLFDEVTEKRPENIISLASVVLHVARLLLKKTKSKYIIKAIPKLLPHCMSHQFNVRRYSQEILIKLYKMLPQSSADAQTYKDNCTMVEKILRYEILINNYKRVLDDFWFTIFDPEMDFNVETLYYDLPRLANVSQDGLIPIDELTDFYFCEERGITIESRIGMRLAKPTPQSSKPIGEQERCVPPSMDGGLSDIQTKVTPWKTMVPFYDDLSEISKARLLRRKTENEGSGIIVVASLIGGPSNLGGIARTCEIFGAKELVIASLRFTEDCEFQTLSVSAERWITITEVKPNLVQNYLLEKRSEGWELVGAEQTENSINLLEMEFPKKTILLLGNEKDGIPANLIPLLDICVEIPQNGVVTSLNVHVAGALCIWQYAKQHLLT